MIKYFFYARILTVVLAASYMTLVIYNISEARQLILPYALLLFILTAFNLWGEKYGK